MNKKIKFISLLILIIIIITVSLSSVLGNTTDDNPHHIVLTAPGNGEEPKTGFNPITGWGCGHLNFNPLIQSTLLNSDKDGNFTYDIANNYTISPDGLKWTVYIRNDIKFSNNKPLLAKDVAFTFNTAKKSNSQLDLSNLECAKVINNTCIEFDLKEPQSTFIYNLRYLGIVPEEGYDNLTYELNPVGSGPYKLVQWDKGQQAILEYNENYYGKKPYFTQITLLFPNEDSAFNLVKMHQADIVQASFFSLNETESGYHLVEINSPRAQGVSLPYLNDTGLSTIEGDKVGNNITADIAIRKALNVGINRSDILNSVYNGHGKVDYTGVDNQIYANPNAIIVDGNILQAKKILKNGGWVDSDGDGICEKNGIKARFKLYYSSSDISRQSLAMIISNQAKKIGIDIELVSADWDTIYSHMYEDAVIMQQSSEDPERTIYQQYHSKINLSSNDYMNPNAYNNSEVDCLLDRAMASTDLNNSNELWKESACINENSGFGPIGDCPWLWVVDYHHCYFVRDGVNLGDYPKLGQDYMWNILNWTRN